MSAPSPWLTAQLRDERAARHSRRVASVQASVIRAAMGGSAAAAVVILLQRIGVLP